jgi:Peptidase S46
MRKGLKWTGLLVLCLGIRAVADEGMWPFDNVPKARIKAKYGFEPTQAWLDHLRLSSVRMGDSGSFVSSNGLILTNHHVGRKCIIAASTKEKDLMESGFYAKSPAEEIKCAGMQAEVLQSIEDITANISAVASPAAKSAEAANARRAVLQRTEEQCKKTGLRCETVILYGGAVYHLYRYKRYTDVRLVFAPEVTSAFFGGDPDNYTFPRYDLDIAFFRAYENGSPAHTSNYLKVSTSGAKEGSLVFAAGNPASTARLSTVSQLEYLRDVIYPAQIKSYSRRAQLLREFSEKSPEKASMVGPLVWDLENRLKAIRGYQAGLLDKDLMAKKAAEEQKLRKMIAADARLRAEYGDPWGELERTIGQQRKFDSERHYPESVGLNGRLATYARTLVRAAAERSKPNDARLPEFRGASWSMQERDLTSKSSINKDLEEITLVDSLEQLVDELGSEDPLVRKILGGKTPAERAHDLIATTKLDDPEVRKELLTGGQAAIDASTDPLIIVQRSVDQEARSATKRMAGRHGAGDLTGIRVAVGETTYAANGFAISPDATSSLRLTFGVVKGVGADVPFTTMGGAFAYAEEKGAKPPYQLPESWVKAKGKINPNVPLNEISTLDVIGGNSGSPVVNTEGELVGVAFDANKALLAGRYVYDEEGARAMSVDSRAILEGLRKIYNANGLADELTGSAPKVQ